MAVFSANKTELLFDGEKIHGLSHFSYEVFKDTRDVSGIGIGERIGVARGGLKIQGLIGVNSNSELLNKHLDNNTHFQIIMSVQQDTYPEGLGVKQFTFDGCHIEKREFTLEAHGVGHTVYTFNADRVREA